MDLFLLLRKSRLLLPINEALLFVYYTCLPIVSTQGLFPKLENLAAFKPISTEPPDAMCGFPQRSVFCHSDLTQESLRTCAQRLCVQDCPYRSVSPAYHQLLLDQLGSCIRKDWSDLRPKSKSGDNSSSFIFYDHRDCFVTAPSFRVGSSFSLTVWLKPERDGVMCAIEKSADGQIVFKLAISEKETVFYYRTVNGLQPPIKVMTQGTLAVKEWIHLSVQVDNTRIGFFINGPEEDLKAFDFRILSDPIHDIDIGSTIRLGQSINGSEQFVGRIQDFRLYHEALTNREISEVYNEKFHRLHVQSMCRCPGSHPQPSDLVEGRYCIPNGADDATKDRVLRLNSNAHPLAYMNDNDLDTTWISGLLSWSDLDNGISIVVDLMSGEYQVFYITLRFYSSMPKALKVQRRRHRYSVWEDWQYLARNCQDFGMENNGFLEHPDSVNCLRLPKDTPYSNGNVTLSLLTPEPNHRPGYKHFFSTYSLQEFVKASQVRIQLIGQYHTAESNVSFRHRYYGIREITVSGRCDCHGHANSCDTSVSPYKCLCDVKSYTAGDNCERCLQLYNNKPFRQGDQVNAYNCRACQCHNHSSSCHYNASVDPYPYDHDRGGGGTCDNCLHHTAGRNCEACKDYFYRQFHADPSAVDVCQPCDCNEEGTVNKSRDCEKVGGQCKCKPNVSGRRCDQCTDGFHNMNGSDPKGCQPCHCNTHGTLNGSITCHQTTGQCNCKPNIIGPQCHLCKLGLKQDPSGQDTCIQCTCSAHGSINQFCNPTSGQCKCRENVRGPNCDTCIDGYYGLEAEGCKPCDCHLERIIPGTVCDGVTGQCVCQDNVGGRQCDECMDGYYEFRQDGTVSCLPCQCDSSGTINSSQSCDRLTGRCPCKAFVTGLKCNICVTHMYNLTAGNILGCQNCDCDPLGTLPDTTCDQSTGQCWCVSDYEGRRCSQCAPGFYLSSDRHEGCSPCYCHASGSINASCSDTIGQCHCQDSSVSGLKCNQCSDSFYGFDVDPGRCQPCRCNTPGALNGSCHAVTGRCFCKQFAKGFSCSECTEDSSNMDINNPYGCSATPSQQPYPSGLILNSTTIRLMWNPPDYPNSDQIKYVLYRDDLRIYESTDYYPYRQQSYMDKSLSPYTSYTYHVDAKNVHGLVSSTKVAYRTKPGVPSGKLELSLAHPVAQHAISVKWTFTPYNSSLVETFRLTYTSVALPDALIAYEGLDNMVTVSDLTPFTRYNFSLHACTAEGCLQSSPLTVVTAQAPPAGQNPPVVQNFTSTDLRLEWSPPSKPNGVVIRHELYMRGLHQTIERRVFHANGWLNPQPVVESENENVLLPPVTRAVITNLEPNTEYEFCVVTTNMAGSVASEWVTLKTAESEPVYMPPPTVMALSSHLLNISWERPTNHEARGDITGYAINMVSGAEADKGRDSSEVIYVAENHELFYEMTDLEPYHDYAFTITLCNKVGCVTSRPGAGKTLAAAPEKLKPPLVKGINGTTMKITWSAPVKLNGPSPVYQLERIEPSLTMHSNTDFIKGTHFPGHGYFKFPASTLPANTHFTGIKIQFRTKDPEGLILCAMSAGTQEEYIVLQIRNGRPHFLFDPQDSAVSVTPTNDGNKDYSDNKWHEVIIRRRQNTGDITVDGKYTGSVSAMGGGTVIGENTGVFVGGLPNHFTIRREDLGDTEIIRKNFVGCLGDIYIQKTDNPDEEWALLIWDEAEERSHVYDSWEGCPQAVEEGAHFLGFGFLELYPAVFPGGLDIDISFMFKSDQLGGLFLFMYNTDGPDYFIVQLNNGILTVKYKTKSSVTQVNLWAGLSYCDGRWNMVRLRREASSFSVQLNNLIERAEEPEPLQIEIHVNSLVYVGGVPDEVMKLFPELSILRGFGGCMKDIQFTRGVVLNITTVSSSSVRVNLDGCPSSDGSVNCRGNDSVIIYRGREAEFNDYSVDPFTEYLYRVIASNDGGAGTSPWSRGRSKPAVPPNGQTPLRVLSVSGHSVEVTWDRPEGIRGVIEQYILKANPENEPDVSAASVIILDTSQVNGTLTGLRPFTEYAVSLSACTLSGCGVNAGVLYITTREEAPGDVQTPTASSSPHVIYLHWMPPLCPNGVITKYILYMNGSQIYSGNGTQCNVTGLSAFTAQKFLLAACTLVGCTNSSQVTLFTAQRPPEEVFPPELRALDSRSIYAQWKEPGKINGILERYLLYIANDRSGTSVWNIIYNSTELFLDYTLQGLTPGTRYFVKISACSGGGCTTSDVNEASTEESSPEGIQALDIQSASSDSFNISWSEPLHPNGVITSYGLYMDGILMQNSSHSNYFVDGLAPWSKHSFRLQACTVKGCAVGEKIDAYTQESQPEGEVLLDITINDPRSVDVKWQGPERPNGQMTYDVIFHGLFYEKEGDEIVSTTSSRRILHQSRGNNQWVFIDGLVPFSDYSVQVNASNSQGHVTSKSIRLTMPPGVPDGVLPPRLSSGKPTSLQVVWSTPVRNNAAGLPGYRLQMRSASLADDITEVFSGPSASLTYIVRDLQPYTAYDLRIVAFNAYGDTYSKWVVVSTEEDKPDVIDLPHVFNVTSNSTTITWQPPTKPNGVITHYNIYQNGSLPVLVPGNMSSHTFNNLIPYITYGYQLEGCTSAGCSLSKDPLIVTTLPYAPSKVRPPDLFSDTPTSVMIKWGPPLHPNGVIEYYTVERRLKGTENIDALVTLPGNHPTRYIDQTSDISPWKTYEYRIVAATLNGGPNVSDWTEVTTRPSRPVGVQPPEITILGPYTAKVTWKVPLLPNGDILSYEIRMPDPRIVITDAALSSYTVSNLTPYTNYSVTIVACSGGGTYLGGCTESLPTLVTTQTAPPEGISPLSAVPVSETFIALSWLPPSRPNGPDIRYELLRRTILQPLALNPPEDLNLWQNIYSGTQWFYEDKGLSRYTSYEYRLIVHNTEGYTAGTDVTATTLPGHPLRGSQVSAQALSHTAIEVSWSKPTVQDLQGDVDHYTILLRSPKYNKSLEFQAEVNHAVIGSLHPNTEHQLYLEVSNGPHSVSSGWVHVTTLDGAPEGMRPPEVVPINYTAVRVIWTTPSNPNGAVTQYSIYVNNKIHATERNSTFHYILGDLAPYTVYNIQVEVCTVYACTKSNETKVTTAEREPNKIPSPVITSITSRSLQINWAPPEEPNGIILGFELRRKAFRSCRAVQTITGDDNEQLCLLVKCKKDEDVCGNICYNTKRQVCCSGVLHTRRDRHECCDENYIVHSPNSSYICCAGQTYDVRPYHRCCGGYYIRVHAGEVCCYDRTQNRVSIGDGDSCCGVSPYSVMGYQACCGQFLYDGFSQSCCGGKIIPPHFICCGDGEKGSMYRKSTGLSCCGTYYVNMSESVCCSGSNGQYKAHLKTNSTRQFKCCESELIAEEEECCNGIGYNRETHICSDKPLTESSSKVKNCKSHRLCPLSMLSSAYCGQCSFNFTTDSCFWTTTNTNTNIKSVGGDDICPTDEDIIYVGDANSYVFIDTGLDPFTTYEYQLSAWNSFDHGFSNVTTVTTNQDIPQGISPPRWSRVDNRDDVISLNWQEPTKSNGVIHYILLRDGVERFNGIVQSFEDHGWIQSFKGYTYALRACTIAGCLESVKAIAAIEQGVPENVSPPIITTVNATALHLSWTAPTKPKGIIREYQIHQTLRGLLYMSTSGKKQYTVTGLEPYTKYSFFLIACTSVGCNSSEVSTGHTSQAPPHGVWLNPYHVTINSSALELYWGEPEKPRGTISRYRLIRNGTVVSTRSGEYLNFTDAGLQPDSRYLYQLEATNKAGSNISNTYIVETPLKTPEKISVPHNITALGPYSVFVAWDLPGVYDPNIPLEFNILLNAGSVDAQVHPAGEKHFIILEDLTPGSLFYIRLQVCQNGSCGVGGSGSVVTAEAAPEDLSSPLVSAIGPKAVKITWSSPQKPNGVISRYMVFRRLAGAQHNMTKVFDSSGGTFQYIDTSNELLPYTAYEYRIAAENSAGFVESQWSLIHTLEAAPENMGLPRVKVTGAYSVMVSWSAPERPNGIVKKYVVLCQESSSDFHSNTSSRLTLTVPGTSYEAKVFGLLPFTSYHIWIEAFNSAGSVSTRWVPITTQEASPSSLSNFTAERKENGRALLLKWPQPIRTNGALLTYNIYSDGNLEYSGLSRQFLLRRLEPYTVYTLVLEACSAGGCTRTIPQLIQTDEAPPSSQLPPQIKSISASQIALTWSPPVHPNGKMIGYEVIKRCLPESCSGNKKTVDENIVYRETDTEDRGFTYTDDGLQPWTHHEYKVRAWNSVGYTDSPWTVGHTSQAAPTQLLPPKIFQGENNPNQIVIEWTKPEKENGKILYYRLQKNNITVPFSFDPATFNYTDEDVGYHLDYTYSIIACTLGGCTTSGLTHITTFEGPPGEVHPPVVESLSATEINVIWSPPSAQNGEITKYILQIDNETYFAGKRVSQMVSNLQPFTSYTISLLACTNGGCTSSLPIPFLTMEAPPSHLKSPRLAVTSAQSIQILWQSPNKPNGDIQNYELYRDGQLIYSGLDMHFHDFGLEPGTDYTYTVQATNKQGSCLSDPTKVRTHSSSPSGMEPPKLQAMGAHEILVTWKPPIRTNGDIVNYTLYVHHPTEVQAVQYHLNHFISQMSHSFLVRGLKPYQQYDAKVEACTLLGCSVSEWATGRTSEAPPESQPAPLIDMQADNQAPRLAWNGPQEPNGKIIGYEIYRRSLNDGQEIVSNDLVFNGSSMLFQDVTLLPYTEYQYQVWAVNSAGRTPSPWTYCRTGPGPPEGLHAPTFHTVSATVAVANITPPTKPNGIITLYRLFSKNNKGVDMVLSEGTSNLQTIYGLKPFTNYSVGVEACTCMTCCSRGPPTLLTTQPAPPSNQRPPDVTRKTSRAASLQWGEPQSPNGIIERYEVYMQIICPDLTQLAGASCSPGPVEMKYSGSEESCDVTGLQPFTTYSFRVACYNSAGSTSSEWVTCTTLKEEPVYKTSVNILSNITTISLDWGLSFQLNGLLKEFVLTERGQRIYSGLDTSVHLPKTTDKTFYFQVRCVTDMGSVSTPVVKYNPATGLAPVHSIPSTKNETEARGNTIYTELWFILVMALLGLLLLAILLSLILKRKLSKEPFPRERPPLVPLQQRMSPANTQNETYTKRSRSDTQQPVLQYPVSNPSHLAEQIPEKGISDIKVSGMESQTSHSTTVVRKTSQSQISHSCSQNSLYCSASELIASQDKTSLVNSSIWDSVIQGHDSGLYMDDEDLVSTIKSFSTVTKQHTAFTDTPL